MILVKKSKIQAKIPHGKQKQITQQRHSIMLKVKTHNKDMKDINDQYTKQQGSHVQKARSTEDAWRNNIIVDAILISVQGKSNG